MVRRELDRGIEPVHQRSRLERHGTQEEKVLSHRLEGDVAPMFDRSLGVGQKLAAIHHQHGAVVDLDVARVVHVAHRVFDESLVALRRADLRDEDVLFRAVPAPTPCFVRPAEAKPNVDVFPAIKRCQRPFQQSLAAEPIVMDAKAGDPVSPGQRGLAFQDFLVGQIVEAEVGGKMGLIMPGKLGQRPRHVRPLGKAAAP